MRIFVFEYTTGGGLLPTPSAAQSVRKPFARRLDHDLLAEGRAMVAALASDFAALAECEVHVLRDCDVDLMLPAGVCVHVVHDRAEYLATFDEQAAESEWTVLIAPECDGALLACAERVLDCGGRLLSPGPSIVRLASDKHATTEHLARAGVPVPRGTLIEPRDSLTAGLTFPLVIKPRDGAGSQGVRLLHSPEDFARTFNLQAGASESRDVTLRVEEYCLGEAASVAFLCGPRCAVPLPPCRQRLSQDGRFTYLGGSTPLDAPLARRATTLASRAMATLGGAVGYLGVDLVLGPDSAGAEDRVIEINPRLTTSYVGLRAAYDGNLAAAMLEVAEGRTTKIDLQSPPAFSCAEWDARFDPGGSSGKT